MQQKNNQQERLVNLETRVDAIEKALVSQGIIASGQSAASSRNENALDSIGERIHLQMRLKGITQKKMGDALGIHQSVVSNVIRGKRSISVEKLAQMAKILNVSCDYLIFGENGNEKDK